MKKSILIFCTVLVAFSLTAFVFQNWSNNTETNPLETKSDNTVVFDHNFVDILTEKPAFEFVYKVDSRFLATITKEKLNEAKSIIDIYPKKATQWVESYKAVYVSLLNDDMGLEKSELGEGDVLNAAQIKLLESTDYSDNIHLKADSKKKNPVAGDLEYYNLVYFMTIIPEKEAEYQSGQDALIEYLKENSQHQTGIVERDQLKPGTISFIVTKKGSIANVKLDSSSGYPSIDETMVGLITNMPGKWNPATNSKGEKVEQELVFFFGLEGC